MATTPAGDDATCLITTRLETILLPYGLPLARLEIANDKLDLNILIRDNFQNQWKPCYTKLPLMLFEIPNP